MLRRLPVPWDYRGKKMGLNVLARAEDLFTYPISGVVAHTKKIKEKPDEIKRLIRAGIKANRYMRENRDGTIPILMSTYRARQEVATALYDSFVKGFNNDGSLPEDGFRRLIEDTKRVTKVDREVALSEVADLSILQRGPEGARDCDEIVSFDQCHGAELCICPEVGTDSWLTFTPKDRRVGWKSLGKAKG